MRVRRYVGRRLLLVVPQVLGIVTLTFFVIRVLPGDPVRLAAGQFQTQENLAKLREEFGLDEPLLSQYWLFVKDLLRGDLGFAWYTNNTVLNDLMDRFPATLELITYSLLLALLIGVPGGMLLALKPKGWSDRLAFGYGLFAGALPEFWWALMMIFVFFYTFHIFPAPIGRLDIGLSPPTNITGLYAIDSVLTWNMTTLRSSLAHLALPVITLGLTTCGYIMKTTRQTMLHVLASNHIRLARATGLSPQVIARRAFRNSLPPLINIVGIAYAFLLSGAVLVETVFSWGGVGQYAVQAITTSDYAAIQGVVVFTAVFSLIVYLAVDLIHLAVEPRIRG